MSLLSALIQKRGTRKAATAIPAISATQHDERAATVAGIATVAVANPTDAKTADAEPIQERTMRTATDYAAWPTLTTTDDDRRTCDQCLNLAGRRCLAAWRGEIVANREYEPIRDIPRRCEGYVPGADDPDKRSAQEHWPELIEKRDNHAND